MAKAEKNQRQSLWTTTLTDTDRASLLTDQEIEKAIKHIKDNDIDINKPAPEIEDLAKIFKPEK